jgi:hypothetical protein
MPNDPAELARKLAAIQNRLREELLEELSNHEEDIESLFDPYSYSPFPQEIRDKYLTHLWLIHGIIQQLAQYDRGGKGQTTRVASISAPSRSELVRRVNRKLEKLNGARVTNVEFLPADEEEDWAALITYQRGAFTGGMKPRGRLT